MPSHWTYEKTEPTGDLYQGDIIQRTGQLLEVLASVHGYFCDEKYLGFIVVSQTCDLVIRGGECKTKYVNLAVVRSLESLMPSIIEGDWGTPVPGVFYADGRAQIRNLIERIINQNEQALGLFYLEPDADLKIAVGSVALLRVGIALRSKEHYDVIKSARIGRLLPPFRNKLGWLTGNLYSRVDTPDWPEEIGRTEADKKIERIFKDIDEANGNVWVSRSLLDKSLAMDESIKSLPRNEISTAIKAHAPKPPHEAAVTRVADLVAPLLDTVVPADLTAAAGLIKQSRAYTSLVASAAVSAVRAMGNHPTYIEVVARLAADDRLSEAASTAASRFATEFFRVKRPKDYASLRAFFAEQPLFDADALALLHEHATAIGMVEESIEELAGALRGLKPDAASIECMVLLVQASAARGIGRRLASRLNNDPAFRGAFATPT